MRHASLVFAVVLSLLAISTDDAAAQDNKAVAGTYTLVAANNFDPKTGQMSPMYGSEPKGQMVLTPNGRYSVIIVRSDLPKFASSTRIGGTAQENEAVVRGSVAHFGGYSVGAGGKVLVLQSEHSTFPNWKGARLTRPFAIAGDQLKYRVNSASGGGVADITWKKIK